MGKHLDFYKKCMAKNKMPYKYGIHNGGLCGIAYNTNLIDKELLELFNPTDDDALAYRISGTGYWGYEHEDEGHGGYSTKFTTLRQTIVLFMAAMNGEL